MADPKLRAVVAELERLVLGGGSMLRSEMAPEGRAEQEALERFLARLGECEPGVDEDAGEPMQEGRWKAIDRWLDRLAIEEPDPVEVDSPLPVSEPGARDRPGSMSVSQWGREQERHAAQAKLAHLMARSGRLLGEPTQPELSPGGGDGAGALGAAGAFSSHPVEPSAPRPVPSEERVLPVLSMGDPQAYRSPYRVEPDRPRSVMGDLLPRSRPRSSEDHR